ncbi:MAG: HD domain-containing protein [Bacteroidia bacterium]|nr:HD domain-containing protein [Bacteroidia bacterium]
MIQEIYQKALKFAGEKHANQQVPGSSANYLLHISNVAMEVLQSHAATPDFDLELAVQTAILHDTIEDTAATFDEVAENFGGKVAKAVSALSKNKNLSTKQEQMEDSLKRINACDKEAGIVKLADRITNLQGPPYHWTKEKAASYREEAILILARLKGKNEYLESRLAAKIEAYKQYL